jgi:hypothetical protein
MRFTPQRFALQTAGFRKKRYRLRAKHPATSSDVSSFSADRSVSNQVRHFAFLVTGLRVHRTKTPASREARRCILPSAGTGTRSNPERASGCVRRSMWSRRFPEELRTARDNRESCKSKKENEKTSIELRSQLFATFRLRERARLPTSYQTRIPKYPNMAFDTLPIPLSGHWQKKLPPQEGFPSSHDRPDLWSEGSSRFTGATDVVFDSPPPERSSE